eukprot:scaffold5187_cov23-Tisochrysis_lutea.AAC.1
MPSNEGLLILHCPEMAQLACSERGAPRFSGGLTACGLAAKHLDWRPVISNLEPAVMDAWALHSCPFFC